MFMPSRDRLVDDNPFAMEIERRLESELRDHPGLRELKNARQKQDVEDQLADNKPLEDVLKRVLKSSPNLAKLFGLGQRLQNPFRPETVEPQPTPKPFLGKTHPTYFRFAGKNEGEKLFRAAHLGRRVRLAFDTDAVDDYFTRKVDRGEKELVRIVDGKREPLLDFAGPNLADGRGNLNFALPDETKVGDFLEVELVVRDPVTGSEFVNAAKLSVLAAIEAPSGPKNPKSKPDKSPAPEGPVGNSGIALPEVHWVKQNSPNWKTHFSTPDDCLVIIDDGHEGKPDWKFYLNEDNRALQSELKFTKLPAQAVRKQFEIGVVLIGMALLHDDKSRREAKAKHGDAEESDDTSAVDERVKTFTRAVAPIVLPMIQSLGDLGDEEMDESDLVGQAA